MTTVIIFDQCGQEALSFVVTEVDVNHFNNCYINDYKLTEVLQDEMCAFFYGEKGECKQQMLSEFPTEAVGTGANVIVCGFLP